MTGPEGEKYHGWWRVTSVDPPKSLEFTDGFADQDGKPARRACRRPPCRCGSTEHAGGTRMELRTSSTPAKHMERLDSMGHDRGHARRRSARWTALLVGLTQTSPYPSDRKDTRDEKADREHLPDPRRGHAGPGRARRRTTSGGFAYGGWSVNYWDEQMGQVMGEAMSKPFDLVLGRKTYDIFAALLAERRGRCGRQAAERRHQVRRVAESAHAGVGQLGPDRRRRGRRRRGAQGGRRARTAGARQREPDPDAVAPQPGRRVPAVGLSASSSAPASACSPTARSPPG